MTTDPPDLDAEVILNAFAEGKENAAYHLDCSNRLADEASKWLNLTGAAGFAALGYAAHLFESGSAALPIACGVLAMAAHLLCVACGLVRRCLRAREYYPAANQPLHLLHPGYTWPQIVEGEIDTLTETIIRNAKSNQIIGASLNKLRLAAFWCPLTFLVAWGAAAAVQALVSQF